MGQVIPTPGGTYLTLVRSQYRRLSSRASVDACKYPGELASAPLGGTAGKQALKGVRKTNMSSVRSYRHDASKAAELIARDPRMR